MTNKELRDAFNERLLQEDVLEHLNDDGIGFVLGLLDEIIASKTWTRHYRNDRGIWEDICPHGVGHCNDIHGCDGFCEGLYK